MGNLSPSPTPIDCSKGYRDGISPEEISRLMEIPLIELNWLPDDLETAPQIKPHGLEWVDSSNGVTCAIRITYPNLSIDLISLKDIVRSTLNPVGCNRAQEISGSWIHCSGEFATSTGFLAISMFTTYPLETAQKIAHGIVVEAEAKQQLWPNERI